MAVPKKRKKLDKPVVHTPNENIDKASAKKKPAPKKSSKKLTTAFEIMDNMGDAENGVAAAADTDEQAQKQDESPKVTVTKTKPKVLPTKNIAEHVNLKTNRLGFRFHITCDALMPNNIESKSIKPKNVVQHAPVIEFDFTIPFIWNLPVVGPIAQKWVQKISPLKRPESLKDLLSFLTLR